MLKSIEIENFKSVEKLNLELGRVNVFIGENGCGKSNILESIAFASAAKAFKLDNEFLANRGIRVVSPRLMKSCFNNNNEEEPHISITLNFTTTPYYTKSQFNISNEPYAKWIIEKRIFDADGKIVHLSSEKKLKEMIVKKVQNTTSMKLFSDDIKKTHDDQEKTKKANEFIEKFDENIGKDIEEFIEKYVENNELKNSVFENEEGLHNFIIYSPENTALRNFYKDGQIEPLGINGEGLLKLLKVINETQPEDFKEINETLKLFGWYDSLVIPEDISRQDDKLKIKDKYLTEVLDQNSANEGFFFILFYILLLVSKDTPTFFAIDNIDASLNPKLCTELVKIIACLTKKHNKQVILTTHNPAILDGLDLNDDEQRLLVISRNKSRGFTKAKRITIENKPVSSNNEPLKFSEAMLRGYLGGLPKNF